MSEAAPDPYATAKANLRDTIKWLATSLSAVGAAVIAGASINGLAALEGSALYWAAGLGAAGLLAILGAISVMLNLLTAKVTHFTDLTPENPITREIDGHASDILAPLTVSIRALAEYRQTQVDAMIAAKNNNVADQVAVNRYNSANASISRVVNLAQFLALRNAFEASKGLLFFLTVVVILSLGGYSLLVGGKSKLSADLAQKIVFRPGANWSDVASLFTEICGAQPLDGVMVSKKTFDGWVTIQLAVPGKCGGLELSVPASLVQMVGPQPQPGSH